MYIPAGQIRADQLIIEFDKTTLCSREPQQVKQYNIATLYQKIQLWKIMCFVLGSLITNLTSIALFFHQFPAFNFIC